MVAVGTARQPRALNVTVVGCIADTWRADTFVVGGATIRMLGRREQSVSDSSGFFRIAIPDLTPPATLQFIRIGYRSQDFPVPYSGAALIRMPTLLVTARDDGIRHASVAPIDSQREREAAERRRQQAKRLTQMCRQSMDSARAPAP